MPRQTETSTLAKSPTSRWSRVIAGTVVALVAAVGAIGARARQTDSAQLFQQVLTQIKAASLDSLTDSALFIKAARGLVYELNDPYAALYSPDQLADFRRNNLGDHYAGLGMGIESMLDTTTVTAVFPGSPAQDAGIQRSDRIVAVDQTTIVGLSADEVSKRLTGAPGTKVYLTVVRAGVAHPVAAELTRAVVHGPAVPYAIMLDKRVGYVPLTRVNETATGEVRAAIAHLHRAGATGYILDLRGNPGGELDQALDVSNLFLPQGTLLATVRSRTSAPEIYHAANPAFESQAPVVVLEDGYTASAAEIIAGALQDHDRALVVGTPSFGKGLVQPMFALADGWMFKMTTSRWYTPSGRSIHKVRQFADGHFVNTDDTLPAPRTAAAVRAGRPTVRSDAGRVLYGGGGIVPDVVVPMDTLSTVEQHLVAALQPHGLAARATLYGLARDLKSSVTPGFAARPEWRTMYQDRLQKAGVVVRPALIDSTASFVDALITSRVTEIAFGDSAAFRQGVVRDAQLRRAIELLDRSTDQQSLLAMGSGIG